MESSVAINGRIYRTGCNPVDDTGKLKSVTPLGEVGLPAVTREDAIGRGILE